MARWLISVPLVVLAVLGGLWAAGGLLTNDFGLAMALSAAWMALAGLACALIAWRRPELRAPVLGAYLVTAVLAGAWLGRSQFVDDVVDESVAKASTNSGNMLVAEGAFEPVAHSVRGTARVIRTARGPQVLTLTGFEVDNGPDLRVYLVEGPARTEEEVREFEDLGALKGNKGDQQYSLPSGTTLDGERTVVIWCRAFSVSFARASLS